MTWTAVLMDNVGDAKLQYMVKHECDGCLPLWNGSAGAYVPYTFLRFTHVAVDYPDSSLPHQKIMKLMPAIYFSAFLVDNHIDSFKPKKVDSAEIDGRYCPENMATRYVTMCCEMVPVLCACIVYQYVSSCQYSDTFMMRLKTRS